MKILNINVDDYVRIFVMSDLHGSLDLFKKFLLEEKIEKRDLIIINGDSIDRGTNSALLLEEFISLKNEGYSIYHILGNHENMLYDYVKLNQNKERYILNGGLDTLRQYESKELLEKHLKYIEEMVNIVLLGDYIIVHAGLKPNLLLEKQTLRDTIWIRDEFIDKDLSCFGKRVIFGHTINKEYKIVFRENSSISIDCGIYESGILGVLELKELREIYFKR